MKFYTIVVDFWTDSHTGKSALCDSVLDILYEISNRFNLMKYGLLLTIFAFFQVSAIVVLVFHI
jgi:hypothetical protein